MNTIDELVSTINEMIKDELDIDQFIYVIKSLIKNYSTTVEHSSDAIVDELINQMNK